MKFKVSVETIYYCSLERAFKTGMLCNVAKVHTGYGPFPKVTHCPEDENWGKPGFSKKVHVAKTLFQKGGWATMDKVIDRVENEYWKIEVSEFQTWTMGFTKFVGEWSTKEGKPNEILINYTYTLYANNQLLYTFNWIISKTIWKTYMKHVLENIRYMIDDNEPYLFD